ncbi:MAG TPA: hypothetical protein VJ765_12175 [Chitinophagaceae bacterium]|nr:hypothetical protein [Chitinophagaceae bacterium]
MIAMRIVVVLFLSVCFLSCSDDSKSPDVSKIKVELPVERFDRDLFSLDTFEIEKGLRSLELKYPSLFPIFIHNILGLNDSIIDEGLAVFIRQNYFIAEASHKEFENFNDIRNDFEKSFRYVKYYFPGYKVPKLITIVGPPDALAQTTGGEPTPNFIGPDFLGISLQFYLGKDFPLYHDDYFIANIAPEFRSRRFDKEYIVADAMKLVADDVYPDKSAGKGLIEQIIEKGKQWWLLDKFLPATPDSIKTGYTKQQLSWCKENEGLIWNDIITTQKDLYTKDPGVLQNFIGDAPFTQSMGAGSPGNIGQWVGWQIVEKFAGKNSSVSVPDVLNTNAKKILQEAKYKPK